MKKLTKNAVLFTLGLLFTTLPAVAGYFVKDIYGGWWGGSVSVPSGAIVSYHAYGTYAGVYATGPGVFIDLDVYNGSEGGYQTTTGAGTVDIFLDASGGSCGVTLVW